MSFAAIISINQSSHSTSGYSLEIFFTTSKNLPSVVFITFAFVTIVTFFILFFFAYSNANLIILSDPCVVVTVKSIARSSVTEIPLLPRTYAPSVFSLKKIQSIPSSGIFTGLIFAKRSRYLRIATFALSIFGQGSPSFGVVVGPLRRT